MNDLLDGPREIEYKGYKLGYKGRFNLIGIEGIPSETFTSFAQAQAWVDNPVNKNVLAANEIKVTSAKKTTDRDSRPKEKV